MPIRDRIERNTHTPGNNFLQAPGGVFHAEDVPVTDDDDVTVATGGEPANHPHAHCNDRFPQHPAQFFYLGPQIFYFPLLLF